MSIRPEIAARLREAIPEGLSVIPESLPVISFGDAFAACVATIALNPSWREFHNKQRLWLEGNKLRLESLRSLGVQFPSELTDDHLRQALTTSNAYFQRAPYKQWFNPLNRVLEDTVDASFYDGSACHLDLVQWATSDVQKDLGTRWETLVEKDKHFLAWQIQTSSARTFVLNGKTVVETLQEVGVVPTLASEKLEFIDDVGKKSSVVIYAAHQEGHTFVGWNRTLAYGIPKAIKLRFMSTLQQAVNV